VTRTRQETEAAPALIRPCQRKSPTRYVADISRGNGTCRLAGIVTLLLGVTAALCLTTDASAKKMLTATPTSISFGNVAVNQNSTQTVTLANTGTGSLKITQDTVTGTGFSISGLTLPLILHAGQSTIFQATFTPAAPGSITGSISITTNEPSDPPATVSFSGTGITRLITARPITTTFGPDIAGSRTTFPVILRNTGTGSVTIFQATVSGAAFSLSGPSLPYTLEPGKDTNFSVTFAPTEHGRVNGNVSIVSNATNSPINELLVGIAVHAVHLNWDSPPVGGYNVYRRKVPGGSYRKLNLSLVTEPTYTDARVEPRATYCYVVTAVDSSGNESAYSNEAEASVPP